MRSVSEQSPRPLWRRLLRPVLVVSGLVVVFVWVLPQFISYDDVWSALKQLDAWELAALVLLALARVPTEAIMYRAFLPGLGLTRGSEAYLSSNLAGQLLPPPSASLIQYGYFRSGGYGADYAEIAAFGSFVFPTLGRFLLPLVALLVLLVTGDANGTILLAGALSVAITGATCIAAWFFLRRESTARRLGAKAQRPLSWILLKLKRQPVADGAGQASALRLRTLLVLREGWRLGSAGVAANLLITYLILLASLRFVGVSSGQLTAPDAFAAFAVAFWAGAVIPITGSGLGVVDAVLITMLIESSTASDDALVAAALLWRVFYSIAILPLGAITLGRFRSAGAQDDATRSSAPVEPGL
jgi:uncharacterized membrane protein YbhN (UPF0104 family)